MMARLPVLSGVFEIFLRVDLDVTAWCINMSHRDTALDHVLQKVDQVSLLENLGFAPWPASKFAATEMIMLAQH